MFQKTNESYVHEPTGIKFDVEWKKTKSLYADDPIPLYIKKVRIYPNMNTEDGFVFNRSNPKMIIKIGEVATAYKNPTISTEIG